MSYLLRTEVWVALSDFAGPSLDDCIAEHSDDHDEQEVARVHQVQVDEGAVVLVTNREKKSNTQLNTTAGQHRGTKLVTFTSRVH